MARVVLLAGSVPATATATRELSRRLSQAGHEVALARPEGVASPSRGEMPVPAIGVRRFRYVHLTQRRSLGPVTTALAGRSAAEALDFDAIRRRLTELSPDVVLVDVELPEHTLAALALGVPVAGLSIVLDPWRHWGVPPLDSATVPRGGGASDLGIAGEWVDLLARRAVALGRARLGQRGLDRPAVLRAYARANALPYRLDTSRWLVPGLFPGLPVLVLGGRELDFPHRCRSEVVCVGPMVRPPATDSPPFDRHLAAVVDRQRRSGHPLMYCSFGTFSRSYDPSLVERIALAVGRHPDWHLVVALGGADVSPVDGLPPNVTLLPVVPQLEVLQASDAAVIHAGATSIQECLLTGTPMVSYPTPGWAEQSGNGARLRYHGVGLLGDRSTDTIDAIEERLVTALEDDALRSRVRQLGERLHAYREQGVAETAVAALLEGRCPAPLGPARVRRGR